VAEAREVVLAFRSFPAEHWRKIWSTNPLERLNKEIKRRTRVVGIFRKDAAISRLVGGLLLEQQEEWQLEGGRVFSELSMAKLDSSNDPGQDIPYAALAAAA
jgi:putative transposase